MKKTNNRVMMVLLAALLMLSLVACGTKDSIAPVAEENATVAPIATEEPTNEVNPNAIYVEENELEYEENTKVSTNGVLYVGDDIETLNVINVDWELTNIVMEDADDGTKTVTIEQSIHGYIWTDGNIFATNLNVPVARLADAYTGQMISVGDEDAVTTEIEWKDNVYTVGATEITSWEDGNWDTDWVEDSNGGEKLSSTLNVKTVVSVSGNYDGLTLVLTPIIDANGSIDGEYIMDVWTDGSYLFNVNDMSTNFTATEEVEATETDESVESTEEESKEESKSEETKPSETTATTAPKEEKPVHTHSYNGVVTTNPTCVTNGVKTYTCSCGDSYTENLGTTDHNYVASTTTIHHDEVWQKVARELPGQRVIICRCGAEFTTQEDFDAHRIANIEANGPFIACATSFNVEDRPGETVYDNVKVADAWDETITTYTCSVCGKTK